VAKGQEKANLGSPKFLPGFLARGDAAEKNRIKNRVGKKGGQP
jgi:hypothetical protein